MKFAIITERKTPPDRRVVFSPEKLDEAKKQFPEAQFIVEASTIRVFSDEAYQQKGIEVVNDVSDADVLIGVKEVPISALIPNKKYFFFSHTIKKQPYNRKLLKAILNKNIELYDHETIVDAKGNRLIGFGRFAGIVGAYNGFRAWGLKYNTWQLPKAGPLPNQAALIAELNQIELPNIKILLTGSGKVANGAQEMLDAMQIKSVSVQEYLNDNFNEPVYCKIDVLDYNKRTDGQVLNNTDFFNNPQDYQSNFMRFAKVTDYYIAGHFYGDGAPYLYTRQDVKSPDFNIKVVADISCDVDGPVATTLRASTIAEPIYGYNPQTESEIDYKNEKAIVVMAVDNLPCELPQDASEGFGDMFLKHVIPAFFNEDKDGILQRAKITESGKLTPKFNYLQDFVDEKG
ncbi:NAD(P)-dependent oxidoreductase [Tamlana sp. 62-3]|uniref:Saccharopine dehydrogenase [NAD(+), L-lysine-forming] n=1 Tax=Neotamlana sargassicola TaxID=2883125 RepID=A0A9X1L7I6_9FLAO|nr:NAD(P)-dependent oxidoreductase [Tamlana sargassicola]MCB4808911.1 NAD(P)-dependent oxidoreductase [Tamlana sargassicola]